VHHLLATLDDYLVLLDAEGNLVAWNKDLSSLLGDAPSTPVPPGARQHIFGFFTPSHCPALHADLTAWVGTRGGGNGSGGGRPPADGATAAKHAVLSSVVHPTGLPIEYHFLRMNATGGGSSSSNGEDAVSSGATSGAGGSLGKTSGKTEATTSSNTPSSSSGRLMGSDFVLVVRPRGGRGPPTAPADDEIVASRTSGSTDGTQSVHSDHGDDDVVADPNVAILRALQVGTFISSSPGRGSVLLSYWPFSPASDPLFSLFLQLLAHVGERHALPVHVQKTVDDARSGTQRETRERPERDFHLSLCLPLTSLARPPHSSL